MDRPECSFQWEAAMKVELKPEEAQLLKLLLEKDLGETRVEVHHARNMEYKSHLQEREKLLQELIGRM
jgi:hypothetical protein